MKPAEPRPPGAMEPCATASTGSWWMPPPTPLVRDGQPQALEPKAFAVLLALLRRPGELLERDDLLDQVWGHRHVTPGVLTRAIAQLRAALDDPAQQPRYIQTRHALGYSFIGVLQAADTAPAVAAEPVQPGIETAVAATPEPLPGWTTLRRRRPRRRRGKACRAATRGGHGPAGWPSPCCWRRSPGGGGTARHRPRRRRHPSPCCRSPRSATRARTATSPRACRWRCSTRWRACRA
ncbi:winged helix-turn-helix domain-containing protein [Pseudoxanthomonas sp. NC8]|nr:winged helix-turn-helix domain-containing protein [Pseudoxanthomonas sp. NC8]